MPGLQIKQRFSMMQSLGLGLLLSALGSVMSCSGSGESLVSPCKSELECGQKCSLASPCGAGRYCGSSQTCTADCLAGDSRCGDGKTCNGSGRCVPKTDLNIGGSSGNSGGSSGVCAGTDLKLDKQIPTVLLLVDQSGSMNARFGGSDRWQVLRTSLMNQDMGVVSTLQAQVRFGLALYSGVRNQPCPVITSVAPALNNYGRIDDAYPVPTDAILDNTPTGESIDAASTLLQGVEEPGQKVIVLATDGDPDSCAEPNSNGTNPPREMSLEAAQRAFEAGVFTFVISVAADADQNHLRELANVGQGFPRNDSMDRLYLANDQAQLSEAFATIVDGVRSCVFALDGMVTSGGEARGTVTLNGKSLTLGDPNGWRLSSPSTIELVGTACEAVKNEDSVSLNASFPCGIVIPNVPK